jgi:hypothetical protein
MLRRRWDKNPLQHTPHTHCYTITRNLCCFSFHPPCLFTHTCMKKEIFYIFVLMLYLHTVLTQKRKNTYYIPNDGIHYGTKPTYNIFLYELFIFVIYMCVMPTVPLHFKYKLLSVTLLNRVFDCRKLRMTMVMESTIWIMESGVTMGSANQQIVLHLQGKTIL